MSAAVQRPVADVDQRADHRAHLPVQERQRADIERDRVAVAHDVEPVEGADRRFRLALDVAEGGEVVPADQRPRGLAHGVHVEPRLHPPGAAAIEGERRAAVDDPIEIMAGAGAVARVEIVGGALGLDDRHGVRSTVGVEPLAQPERRPVALEIDMGDLAGRMHAGVGAPRAVDDTRSPVIANTASSRICWTETPFACRCQPTNGAPSYSRMSLKRGIELQGFETRLLRLTDAPSSKLSERSQRSA